MDRVELRVEDGSIDSARELADWLQDEQIPNTTISVTSDRHEATHLGGGAEIVTAVLSSGGVVALVRSLGIYFRARTRKVSVRMTSSDGRQIVVDAANADDSATILRALGYEPEPR